MKRYVGIAVMLTALFVTAGLFSQENSLESDKLAEQGKELDKQIADLNTKIAELIKKHQLLKADDIAVLPYQTQFTQGDGFITIEKHTFLKDPVYNRDIVGIRTKSITIYSDGSSVSKIESKIYERNFNSEDVVRVEFTDPSPTSETTDDITFTHVKKGITMLEQKKLGDVKNTTAYPVRDGLKREFLIPHLNSFYNSILFIAEAYQKGKKDRDSNMADFLRRAAD